MHKRMGLIPVVAAVMISVSLVLGLVGCIEVDNGEKPIEAENATRVTEDNEGSEPIAGDVLMMGRSVIYGWFVHWGWDGNGTVDFHGFDMAYAELPSPPDIGAAAAALIAKRPQGSVVFFKLCFVDFWASSQGDVDANVKECLGYAREAVEEARQVNVKIVLGNALPKVRSETTPALVKAHQRYNEGLVELAAEYENAVVFDQYSLLVSADGSLTKGLAVTADDSHLSDLAYQLLDEALLETLNSLK